MSSFNKVFLMGNVTRDPQLKYLANQTAVAEFGIAVNRKFSTAAGEDREEVTFVDCESWGKTGELIGKFFTKGKPIFIEGSLKFDTWEDKTGGKRSKISVRVESFQFLGAPDGKSESREPARDARPAARTQSRPPSRSSGPAKQDPPFGDEQQFTEDSIPF